MKRLMITALSVALMGAAGSAAAQDAPPVLSIDDSLICAGVFFAQSQLPENAGYPEGVENYRQMTKVFLDRAGILADRTGESTDGHIERAAGVTDTLLTSVNAKTDSLERMDVINSWRPLEDHCIAGGRVAP